MSSPTSTTTLVTKKSSMEENKDTPSVPFQVRRFDILRGETTRYLVMDFIGEGAFGRVAKCVDMTTNKLVAVKILKDRDDCIREKEMLKAINVLDPEKSNIVRFIDSFTYHSFSCLAFEMLDRSLWDLLKATRKPLNLNEIRPVMQQLFVALDALKGIGIVHGDLKPDNIMLVDHRDQPFRVKLIDFGVALPVRRLYTGMTIQVPAYRAPELTLGLPLSEAIDMWSVGCIMSFLYFGCDIFGGDCDYHRMKAMIHILGQPDDLLLSAGKNTSSFFSREEGSSSPGWRLKSPREYKQATGKEPNVDWDFFREKGYLEHEVKNFREKSSALEYEDRMAFLRLLKSILHMDAGKRITPREALAHPFITMAHLAETISYANAGLKLMTVTLSHSLNETDNPLSDTEDHRDDQASDSRAGASDTHNSSHEEADLGALKVSSDKEPSSARLSVKDSECVADESSATETSITGESDTEGYSGTNTDVDTSRNQDAVPATICIFKRHSSIPSSSDKDTIMSASSVSSDDSSSTCSSDEGWDSEPVGDTAIGTEEDSGAAIPRNDSSTNMEENKDTPAEPFQVQRSDILPGKSTRYLVIDFMGEGAFGRVAKCFDMTTDNLVAVKILKDRDDCSWELKMLKAISVLDPEKSNIVRFIESFMYHSFSCLAFEILDKSLWDLLDKTSEPLDLDEIRPVMQQLFVALDALKGIGIVHVDLKPDNIMLVDHRDQRFRVKLIDFGLALPVRRLYTGMTIQVPAYRAPEVTLGLPLSEAVDMWSVGCIMSFLYFGSDMFDGDCDYHRMKAMIHMLGQPEDLLLSAGKNTSSFFSREEGSSSPGWRLKSPEEYKQATGKEPDVEWEFFQENVNLEHEVRNFTETSSTLEYEDMMAFLSLLKSILHMDAGKRITPREALAHPFITMAHLAETSSYANADLMTVNLSHSLNETDNPLSVTKQRRAEQASDSRAGASDTHSSSHEEADLGALKVSSDREPSSAWLSAKDSERFTDESSATETSITGESTTEGYSDTITDIDTSRNQDAVPATICIFNGHSSIPSSSDKDTIMSASSVSSDDSSSTCSSDEGWDSEPVGDTAIATEEDSGAAIPRNDSSTNMEENKDTPAEPFQVQRSDILPGKSTRYLVIDFMGKGAFGRVAKCFDMTTDNLVAVKILKDRDDCSWELKMLKAISVLDPEKSNIVRFIESFTYHSFSCLAFEILDKSLYDLLDKTSEPLDLDEIRPVMQQLFVALDALKGIGIVHGDLKPDNIMLVDHRDQRFRVKLIDFGLALPVRRLYTGMTIQVPAYRAPEVTLGLPLSEAVDMWSVGCIMSFLYFGSDMFDGDCDYHRMKAMIHMLGQPEDLLLSAGKNTSSFFSREEGSSSPGWRLKSPEEYKQATGKEPNVEWEFFQENVNLEHEVRNFTETSSTLEYEDRMAFLSLLKSILHMDAGKRITPREALAHPFITMAHLAETSSYANADLMTVNLSHSLNETDNPLSVTKQRRAEQASDSRAGASDTHSSSHEEADLGALKVSSDREPSSAWLSAKDSERFTDESSATETSITGESTTEGYSDTITDIDTSRNQDVVPATICIFNGHSSIPSSSDKDTIMSANSVSSDDSSSTCSSDEGWDSEPVGDTAIATEEDSGAAIPRNDSSTNMEENKDTPSEPFQVQRSDILPCKSTHYLVMDFMGEGGFGRVAKCSDMTTDNLVAVKILKDRDDCSWEMEMLKAISALDPEKSNIVRFIDSFTYHSFSCLAFEMLDRSLWDLLKATRKPLNLNEIRPVMQQLFVALDALKGIGVVHGDLKPDNIMLVDHRDQPFRVKLIDFGLALPVRRLHTGMTIQVPAYRAPEVTLGLPLSEAVDMWSVGCIMSCLYFCADIFDGDCDYHRIKAMIHILGQPEDLLLSAGKNTSSFFSREEGSSSPGWRLKSPEEYKQATGKEPNVDWEFFQEMGNLEHEVKNFQEKSSTLEYEDRMAFLSLLKSILHMDAGKRITPKEALAHPFITMAHLAETISYANAGLKLVTVTLSHSLNETDNPLSDTEDHRDDQASDSRAGASDTHSSNYEEADLGALKVSTDREPSSARLSAKDSERFTDDPSATETSITGESDTEGYSGTNTDVDTSPNQDAVPATICIFNGHSSIPSSSDKDSIMPANSVSSGDSPPTHDEGWNSEPVGDTGIATEEDSGAAIPRNDSSTSTDDDNTEGAAAAPRRRNLFQRTRKFFRRMRTRLVSVFT